MAENLVQEVTPDLKLLEQDCEPQPPAPDDKAEDTPDLPGRAPPKVDAVRVTSWADEESDEEWQTVDKKKHERRPPEPSSFSPFQGKGFPGKKGKGKGEKGEKGEKGKGKKGDVNDSPTGGKGGPGDGRRWEDLRTRTPTPQSTPAATPGPSKKSPSLGPQKKAWADLEPTPELRTVAPPEGKVDPTSSKPASGKA